MNGGRVRLWSGCGVGLAVAVAVALSGLSGPTRAAQKGADNHKQGAGTPIIFTLKKSFVEKYKTRVTIDADMSVDHAGSIHAEKDDGEIHVGGRAEQIGLPFVAEVMHAKHQKKAVAAMRAAEGKAPVKVTGAWRIWCEHANGVNQTQGDPLQPWHDSNPPHVFEIHPVTRVGELDVLDSVGPPDNFKFKAADIAFTHYENVGCTIKDDGDAVTVRTSMAGYNIPEFILESVDDDVGGLEVEDGRFLFASVRDLDGDLLVHKVRMAFIKGTEAEAAAKSLKKGDRLRVAGLPRISLALVSWRVQNKDAPHEPLTWNLPYEVIVLGVVED